MYGEIITLYNSSNHIIHHHRGGFLTWCFVLHSSRPRFFFNLSTVNVIHSDGLLHWPCRTVHRLLLLQTVLPKYLSWWMGWVQYLWWDGYSFFDGILEHVKVRMRVIFSCIRVVLLLGVGWFAYHIWCMLRGNVGMNIPHPFIEGLWFRPCKNWAWLSMNRN